MSTGKAEVSDTRAPDPRTTVQGNAPDDGVPTAKLVGLAVGLLLAAAIYLLLPDSLPGPARTTAAVAALMAAWWATEAIPIPVTALVPLALFPVFGVTDIGSAAAPYANDVIFLFMGGFMLALAMQRWNLHRRMALSVVAAVGSNPPRLIGGFMLATGFVTMWVSNTATTIMMLPIGLAVIGMVTQLRNGKTDPNFATALMLGIAYASSIGSVATLIGTPPNALMVGYLSENHGIHVGFGQWMMVGLPLAAIFLVIAWVVLTKLIYPPQTQDLSAGRELIREELREMGPMSRGERLVLAVFVTAALSWVCIPLLAQNATISGVLPWLESISDAGIAMAVAIALFMIPVDRTCNERLLDWDTAVQLPWGILLLFGGGLTLSTQFTETGLSAWIGERVELLGGVPTWVLVAVIAGMVLLLTELTSNTATTATFLPVIGGIALGLGMDVMLLVVPAVLAASLAFMMPVATPPNAIVYGSGHIRIAQMVRSGFWLNMIALLLVLGTIYAIAGRVFDLAL
ncbi:SLC13 family permease [Allosalinactinospora lopnorensis]|uniref:SLC13 family permease n=1 Tax=Allosalinactinospora lopnorensis TaxID=1352348 RepID=UPI000623C7C5|nr:DASS family sodium-coupled anion symporter [Allosalinactinospora lopnorensis]